MLTMWTDSRPPNIKLKWHLHSLSCLIYPHPKEFQLTAGFTNYCLGVGLELKVVPTSAKHCSRQSTNYSDDKKSLLCTS